MCGIFGIVNLSGEKDFNDRTFQSALGTLRHRGPDSTGFKRFGNRVILGHTRLSIIDLSEENNQPLSVLERYWIVYNGEIFNYLELRKELEALGVRFRTSGDTEVLLYAYACWGEACVQRFNGMWAFAIYDTSLGTIFCSRDRFGEKPFNYTIKGGQFFFASEVKAILAYRPDFRQPDYNAISNFCRTSVGAQDRQTWFKDIIRLSPGHSLTVRNGNIEIRRYWRYPTKIDQRIDHESVRRQYAAIFEDAVRIRMRSDVPLGVTLSSGIDSSSIACAMHKIAPASHHCFTASYKDDELPQTSTSLYKSLIAVDESVSAVKLAKRLGLHSHVVKTDYKNFTSRLSNIIYYLESGNSSPAVIPLMQLLDYSKQHVKVLLDGQGADELLGGYILNAVWPAVIELAAVGRIGEALQTLHEYNKTYTISYSIKMSLRDLSNKMYLISKLYQRLTKIDKIFGPALREYTPKKDYMDLPGEGTAGSLSRLLLRQHSGGLINLLHYGDALSMAHGIEARMPFLDHRLVELVWTLPAGFKIKLGVGKHLHREAMRGTVPDWILNKKMKFGFSTPIREIFKTPMSDGAHPLVVLLDKSCCSRGLFDPFHLRAIIEKHWTGQKDHGPLLFRILSVELWFRKFIDMKGNLAQEI